VHQIVGAALVAIYLFAAQPPLLHSLLNLNINAWFFLLALFDEEHLICSIERWQTLRGIDALVVAAQRKSQPTKKRRSALFSIQSTGRLNRSDRQQLALISLPAWS
jgi:hypothetical protein